ncbi:MAG: hypothetical protein ACI4GW_01900 [Lachnospiraceae bacterium]
MKIKINNHVFSHQELGLKEYMYQGKKYIDVTPFWIDSKETQRIKKHVDNIDSRREVKET